MTNHSSERPAVVITGASQGLGAALAREFARRGARLLLVARGERALADLAVELRRGGAEVHTFAADLGDKDAIHPLAGTAMAVLGRVDVLIHNASTLGPVPLRLLLDTDCEDLERVLAVNLLGPFRLGKALLGAMLLRGRGQIVQISSDAAVAAYPTWGAYSIAKAAADHLTRIWAAELPDAGVRFVAIDPGEMDTAMHAAAMPDADRTTLAAPATVARAIVDMLDDPNLASGRRVLASTREVTS
jgi:NAD(P)-dependent dehydrogenase (short-subunit alcohol dehydrogenase family)